MDLAFKTRKRLNIQAAITAVRITSEFGKTAPSILNSGYEIRWTDRYVFYDVFLMPCWGVALTLNTVVIYNSS